MAQKISKKLEKHYLFPNHFQLHFKIKLRIIILFFRQVLRYILDDYKYFDDKSIARLDVSIIKQQEHFKKNHWGFCNIFWNKDFHRELIKQWPQDRYFETIKHITKSYDMGFVWDSKNNDTKFLNNFPAYQKAYNLLQSEETCQLIKKITGSKKKYKCSHILLTRAYWGSSVIPHIDSANEKGNINIIVFINASSKKNTGNLGIWKDNQFKNNIFKPTNLRNSCLFYDMQEDFFHGFEPMDFGSFRWAMSIKYSTLN